MNTLKVLCFGEEKKMRFNRGEVGFFEFKIISKTMNAVDADIEKLKGMVVKTFLVDTKSDLETFMIFPEWGLRGWCWSRHSS